MTRLTEIAKNFFLNLNPFVDEITITSDGAIFTDKNHLASHVNGLKDKEVETFKRSDFSKSKEVVKEEKTDAAPVLKKTGKGSKK